MLVLNLAAGSANLQTPRHSPFLPPRPSDKWTHYFQGYLSALMTTPRNGMGDSATQGHRVVQKWGAWTPERSELCTDTGYTWGNCENVLLKQPQRSHGVWCQVCEVCRKGPGHAARWVGASSPTPRSCGCDPGQGTKDRQPVDVSLTGMFVPLSLSSFLSL